MLCYKQTVRHGWDVMLKTDSEAQVGCNVKKQHVVTAGIQC